MQGTGRLFSDEQENPFGQRRQASVVATGAHYGERQGVGDLLKSVLEQKLSKRCGVKVTNNFHTFWADGADLVCVDVKAFIAGCHACTRARHQN